MKSEGPVERPREQRVRDREARKQRRAALRQQPREPEAARAAPAEIGMMGWAMRACGALLALLAGLAAIAAALFYLAPHQIGGAVNAYQSDGEIAVRGAQGPVRLLRDRNGAPYVFAETWPDALFGQGFAVAQDRLYQMELARRYGAGRLAEVAGPDYLPGDVMARTIGFRRLAERRLSALDAPSRAELEAFAAGLNAFIEARPEDLPLELGLIGIETPERWTALDLLTLLYLQSWFFSIPMIDAELIAQGIYERFEGDKALAEGFFPFVPNPDAPGSGQALDALRTRSERPYAPAGLDPLAPLWGGPRVRGEFGLSLEGGASGSNNWAFSGARMGGGPAVIANDPHLDIRSLPGPWHPIGLFTADGVRAVGAHVGLPGIMVGRTDRVGFGVTVGYADVLDLYVETLDPDRPGFVQEGVGETAEWVEARRRSERILIRQGDAFAVHEIEVLETPRGPLLPQGGPATRPDRGLSLRWALASDEMAARPSYRLEPLMRAENAEAWIGAIEGLAEASLNFVVGDVEGRIAARSTGFLPDRRIGDGLTPLPAHLAEQAWAGFVTGPDLPGDLSPRQGWTGTANHLVAGPDFGRPYSSMVSPAWRYRRMKALFDGSAPLSLRLAELAQRDLVNVFAERAAPILSAALDDDPERRVETAAAAEILAGWSRRDEKESAGPLVFQEVVRRLAIAVYRRALGPELAQKMLTRREFWQERFARALGDPEHVLWKLAGVDGAIGRDVLIRQAAVEAMTRLERLHGSDPRRWRWGDASQVRFQGPVPAPEEWMDVAAPLGHRRVPVSGSAESLDRAHASFFPPDPDGRFEAIDSAASLRLVIDLSDDEKVSATLAGGVTGRSLHPHLDDQIEAWASHDHKLFWWFSEARIREQAVSELILAPAR